LLHLCLLYITEVETFIQSTCDYFLQVMVPGMNTFDMISSSNSSSLSVPKLRDDGSNWSDYQPRLQNAMGAKGLWRHVEGTAVAPVPFIVTEGKFMLSDSKTPATEEQIEAKESKIIEFEKREYLARHILMSTTSIRLATRIKGLLTAEDMWRAVKEDATSKSTLHLLSELTQHFQLMLQRRDNRNRIALPFKPSPRMTWLANSQDYSQRL